MLGTLGTPEMIFIFLLALVLFGPKKLPELGRTLAKGMAEFRRASNDLKSTFDREMKNLEADASLKEVSNHIRGIQNDTYNYDYSSYEHNYDDSYGSDHYDQPATIPSTEGASVTQGAESTLAIAPAGTISHGSEQLLIEQGGHSSEPASTGHMANGHTTAEHNT